MSDVALRLTGLRKRYGRTRALDGLDLEVPRGSVFGLVGPNGAGKTTTFGVVSGAVKADAGTVDVLGEGPFDAFRHAGRVSVVPQDCALPPHSSARQLLTHYARLGGLDRRAAAAEAERLLEVVHLADRADARVRQLSHGMRRRLAVAQALLGSPELVLLDEPTGGLDPHLVVEMRQLLSSQRGERTIVVSSHILADLESTCDHVAFLEKGVCLRSGPMAEVTRRAGLVRLVLAAPVELASVEALLVGREPEVSGHVLAYRVLPGEGVAEAHRAIVPALLEAGVEVLEVRVGESLEDAYLAERG